MQAMTLQEKVRALIIGLETNAEEAVGAQPGWRGFEPTEFESNMRSWGCVYGIAFGLARTEEPCESIADVARRAEQAAWPVFVEYTGGGFQSRARSSEDVPLITTAQIENYIAAAREESGISDDDFAELLRERFEVDRLEQLPRSDVAFLRLELANHGRAAQGSAA